MKILYIGNYRDNTSLGRVCRDYLLSLIEAGADIVARPVLYSSARVKSLDPRILKAESSSSADVVICVQQLHHSQLLADTRFQKNVAIVGFNNNPPKSQFTDIHDRLMPFDDVICVNRGTQFITGKLGDVVYQHPVTITPTNDRLPLDNEAFIFYFIGKLSQRKNLDLLATAFHREFHRDEPVELLIKTSCDINPNQAQQIIDQHLQGIKNRVGKYNKVEKYKNEKIALGDLLDENWGIVHNTGNCLVMPSYGEFTPLVANLALAYGNNVIVNNTIGLGDLKEFAPPERVEYCESNEVGILDSKCANLTNFDIDNGATWYEISITYLQDAMRSAYTTKNSKSKVKIDNHKEMGEQLLGRILK